MTRLLLTIYCLLAVCSALADNKQYEYYPSLFMHEHIAKDCETYIRDNIDAVKIELQELNGLYKASDSEGINNLFANGIIKIFDSHLVNCFTAFAYTDGGDYFGEAHSNLVLIEHVANNREDFKEPVELDAYFHNVMNNLQVISVSRRIDKP